jgi:lipopolysaccharide transport system permease protein
VVEAGLPRGAGSGRIDSAPGAADPARRTAGRDRRTLAPLLVAWRYRELIAAVLRRELASRFSGSAFGWAWAVIGPLVTLAIYVITFTMAIRLPVASAQAGVANYALSTFIGLIVFGLFSELCCRAPGLLHEHAWFLKTSIFPSETLAWTAVLRALAFAGISFAVFLVFYIALNGLPPPSIMLLPALVAPLVLMLLGLVWSLAALGAFTRDLSYLMMTIVPLLLFATPVFYRGSDLPLGMGLFIYLNPLGSLIEMMRAVVLGGALPGPLAYGGFVLFSLLVCRGGYAVFARYKGILVDVI